MPSEPVAAPSRTRAAACLLAAVLGGCQSAGEHAPLSGKGVTVYAAGDIADCRRVPASESGAARTASLIEAGLARDAQAVVINLGDSTYPAGKPAEFRDCYAPTWGRFKARTYPAPGNHEYYTPDASGYYDYFGELAGPARRGYYSVMLDDWHVISLNSNLKPPADQAQLDWLKAELQGRQSRCTLAFWHHPLYSSGGHGVSERMREAWRVLQTAGAEVVLAAHDHDYERFVPQNADGGRDPARGMRQFVVGTGGAQLTPLRLRSFHSEASYNFGHGVLKLVLKEDGYEWEFLPVQQDGFADRGVGYCH